MRAGAPGIGSSAIAKTILALTCACMLAACASRVQERAELSEPAPPPPSSEPVADPLLSRLAVHSPPERVRVRERYRFIHELSPTGLPDFKCVTYRPAERQEVAGFTLVNRGSDRINPRGLQGAGALRYYKFLYPDRALENIYLTVTDDVAVSGRYSYDNMFRELHFFPRLELPSVEKIAGGARLRVTLPTRETVDFDADSKEIVGGVLREAPLDANPNRHARRNPGITYRGRNLMITVAQRGEAPRLAEVWGQSKYAEVYYPAKYDKPCRVSPALIWDQRPKPGDADPRLAMLHPTDDSLFALLEGQCRWDLSELSIAAAQAQGQWTAALEGSDDR
jgi:hypothetical protein